MKRTTKPRQSKPLVITFWRASPKMPVSVAIARGEAASDFDRPKADRESHYWVERISSDWGIAARFRKAWDGAPPTSPKRCTMFS